MLIVYLWSMTKFKENQKSKQPQLLVHRCSLWSSKAVGCCKLFQTSVDRQPIIFCGCAWLKKLSIDTTFYFMSIHDFFQLWLFKTACKVNGLETHGALGESEAWGPRPTPTFSHLSLNTLGGFGATCLTSDRHNSCSAVLHCTVLCCSTFSQHTRLFLVLQQTADTHKHTDTHRLTFPLILLPPTHQTSAGHKLVLKGQLKSVLLIHNATQSLGRPWRQFLWWFTSFKHLLNK